ncbi:hypothetical protein [Undibacterium sp. Tian12W]|uniref:hypothetical protein n=1 Tax=Undibacterium sp. Tian12W TaxID=3413054 RepID=UPI003BF171B7
MSNITVPITKLTFDLENPRYVPQKNQREALERILLDNTAKTIALAEHIVSNGQNPIDIVAAIPTGKNDYVVVEGNRRTAVLKVLNKPVLLDSIPADAGAGPFIKKMKSLASKVSKSAISKLQVFVFETREEADVWIQLKHTGENEGAGTVPWDGIQRARFRKGDAGLNILDFGKANNWFTEEDLTSRGPFPISTLNRVLGDPAIRTALGLTLSGGKLDATVPVDELAKGIKKVVHDLATGKWNVTSLKSKLNRQNYLAQFASKDLPSKNSAVAPWRVDIDNPPQTPTSAPSPKTRNPNRARATLIPSTFVIRTNQTSPRLQKIYQELRRLRVETNPNSVAVLLRVFFELSLDDYIARNSIQLQSKRPTLAEKTKGALDFLKAQGKLDKNQIDLINRFASDDPADRATSTSITTLHAFVHSRHGHPLQSELQLIWDNISSFMFEIAHT